MRTTSLTPSLLPWQHSRATATPITSPSLTGYRTKQHLRDARDGHGRPLYYDQLTGDGDVPRVMGLPIRFSTNVSKTDAGTYNPFTPDATIGGAGSPELQLLSLATSATRRPLSVATSASRPSARRRLTA